MQKSQDREYAQPTVPPTQTLDCKTSTGPEKANFEESLLAEPKQDIGFARNLLSIGNVAEASATHSREIENDLNQKHIQEFLRSPITSVFGTGRASFGVKNDFAQSEQESKDSTYAKLSELNHSGDKLNAVPSPVKAPIQTSPSLFTSQDAQHYNQQHQYQRQFNNQSLGSLFLLGKLEHDRRGSLVSPSTNTLSSGFNFLALKKDGDIRAASGTKSSSGKNQNETDQLLKQYHQIWDSVSNDGVSLTQPSQQNDGKKQSFESSPRVPITLFKEIFGAVKVEKMIEKVSCSLKKSIGDVNDTPVTIANNFIATFQKNVVPLHQIRQLCSIKAKEILSDDGSKNPLFQKPKSGYKAALKGSFGNYQFPGRAHASSLHQIPEHTSWTLKKNQEKKSLFGSTMSTLSSPQLNPIKQEEEVRSLLLDSSDSDEIETLLQKQRVESQQDFDSNQFTDDENEDQGPTDISDLSLTNNFARAFEMMSFFTSPLPLSQRSDAKQFQRLSRSRALTNVA